MADLAAAPSLAVGTYSGAYAYGYWSAADLDGYHWYYEDRTVRRGHPNKR